MSRIQKILLNVAVACACIVVSGLLWMDLADMVHQIMLGGGSVLTSILMFITCVAFACVVILVVINIKNDFSKKE